MSPSTTRFSTCLPRRPRRRLPPTRSKACARRRQRRSPCDNVSGLKPGAIDYLILAIYFAYVLGIGWLVKRKVKTASVFVTSGHSIPVWVTSLPFIATNLGAQEVIGLCASGAQYGIMNAQFYCIAA